MEKRKKSVIIRISNNEIQVENINEVKTYLRNIEQYNNKCFYVKRKQLLRSKKRAKRSYKQLNKIIFNNRLQLKEVAKVLDNYEYKGINFASEEQKATLELVLKLTTTKPGTNPLPPIESKL